MSLIIPVGMGEMKLARSPNTLAVYGIGSCIIVTLHDTGSEIGGIVHIMLPDSTGLDRKVINPIKFADLAVAELYQAMKEEGILNSKLVAKIIGGSEMFPPTEDFENNIGRDNAIAAKIALKKLHLPVIAEDTGGRRGRSIEFDPQTGIVRLTVLGEEVREI